jgi:hypothetical protein
VIHYNRRRTKSNLAAAVGAMAECNLDEGADQQATGVIIALLGTTMSVLGLNGQKYALMHANMVREKRRQSQEDGELLQVCACINWRWILGFVVYAAGQGTEALAYSYAGQALVATLTQLSQATNAIVANLVFGESFSIRPKRSGYRFLVGWDLGSVAIIIGSVAIVALTAPPLPCDLVATATHSPSLSTFRKYFDGTLFLVYLAVLFVVVIVTTFTLYRGDKGTHKSSYGEETSGDFSAMYDSGGGLRRGQTNLPQKPAASRRKLNALLFGLLAAVLGALTTSFVKPSVTIFSNLPLFQPNSAFAEQAKSDFTSAESVYTWLLVTAFFVVATANIVSLNLGMSKYDSLVVYPVYSVGQTVLASISGLLLYKADDAWLASYQCAACFTAFAGSLVGVCLLTIDRQQQGEADMQERLVQAQQDLQANLRQTGLLGFRPTSRGSAWEGRRAISNLDVSEYVRSLLAKQGGEDSSEGSESPRRGWRSNEDSADLSTISEGHEGSEGRRGQNRSRNGSMSSATSNGSFRQSVSGPLCVSSPRSSLSSSDFAGVASGGELDQAQANDKGGEKELVLLASKFTAEGEQSTDWKEIASK